MPSSLLSNCLDCFACCGQANKDARHDQYLQPLNLLQPQVNSATGEGAAPGPGAAAAAATQGAPAG